MEHDPSNLTRKSSRSPHKILNGVHRFEHWYRGNQVYLITARCRDRVRAFQAERAKAVFWDRFEHYTATYGFTPWITCLLDNHYHTLGYLKRGEDMGVMMQRIHGSVAKLVNDLLEARLVPFWRGEDGHDYFDGCLRDETQCRRSYRYIWNQPCRHGICAPEAYAHTRVRIELERGLKRAMELKAFLYGVPYKRYEKAVEAAGPSRLNARYHVLMPEYIAVCSTSELPPGSTKCVHAAGRRIALYNLDGEIFATQESCTHAEASLCDGDITGDEIVCPLHFATFNIRTGECTGPPAYEDLATYPIRIEGDSIMVQV